MQAQPVFVEYTRSTARPGRLAQWLAAQDDPVAGEFTVEFGGAEEAIALRTIADLRQAKASAAASPESLARSETKLMKAVPFSPGLEQFRKPWSEGEGFLIEQRTFDFKPGRMRPWIHAYRDIALPVHQKLLGCFVFMGTTEAGELNQVIYMWAYRDLADREERRAAVEADPGWAAFARETKSMQAYRKQSSAILRPTARSRIR